MSHVLSVAKKETRAFFRSPIALIFLGVYLLFTLMTFFGVERFFARNIADLRPLFSWLPILLIFLCSALTMRQWSEEQKMGTLEVLLTLPVKIGSLVVGKFLASLFLVTVALLLTLPVPIMVSMHGSLDWGPVIGGYVGGILLAGAYLSIGLFISALTDNQIVSLITSTLVCGVFWLIGADVTLELVGNTPAEIMSSIGTGARFESIRRGVLDLRDLVYYATLIASFLTLNVVVLSAKGWSKGKRTAKQRGNAWASVVLVIANVLCLNFLSNFISSARVDMTERGEYTISEVTKDLVKNLEEPLLIRGYFSEKTHPLLAPLVPRIRDVIEEYGELGGRNVRTEYVDPRTDEELEKDANQLFGIKSFPFRIADARDQAVVNSYFSVLVKYGDQFEVMSFDDLIEIRQGKEVEVKLRNLEYDLTRAIKKVAYGFQTLDAVFAQLESPAEITAFISSEGLPENFKEGPATVEKVLTELSTQSDGKLSFEIVDPASSEKWSPQKIYETYGLRPFQVSLLSADQFYFHLVVTVGDRAEGVFPTESLAEADIKKEITAALERSAPGFLKTVGLAKPKTPDYSQIPPQMRAQMPPPPPDLTRTLQQTLSESYTVEPVELDEGKVGSDVDVLFVYAPSNYTEKQAFAIDQHLMKGGTVIVAGGRFELDTQASSGGGGIAVKSVTTGLEDILSAYGLRMEPEMVMDMQNEPIAVPVERDLGGMRVREIQYVRYPFFVDVRGEGLAAGEVAVAGLNSVTLPWASPIIINEVKPAEGEETAGALEYTELLTSSAEAWTEAGTDVQPDLAAYPEMGFPVGSGQEKRTLAVAVTGSFTSAFKGKAVPEGIGSNLIESSPASARLVLVSSSSFVSDVMPQLSQQAQTSFQLAQNLVDWGLEDTDLLSIRSRGTFARTLAPMSEDEKTTAIAATAGACVLALLALVFIAAIRQRALRPYPIIQPSKDEGSKEVKS